MIQITQSIIPKGRKNRPGRAMVPQYITIHDTGNASKGAGAKSHANYILGDAAASGRVSWHFTVDDEGAYQHLPLNETGYHAADGAGPGNRKSIGIEICMNADGDRAQAEANAAELVADLIRTVPTLKPFPACMKQHFDWNGKNCPQVIRARPNGWGIFLGAIAARRCPLQPTGKTDIDDIKIDVNGQPIAGGLLIAGLTMVPARAVAEALGATVKWDAKTRTVKISV